MRGLRSPVEFRPELLGSGMMFDEDLAD
ncbi:MAG TPA: hypothetical protein VM597_30640 [Gemmataceae bacterium]|nr:hypothetical protein [Gemmataceae bacterium]